ncbi:mitochondrial ribosomal protein L46 isoform X2 [Nomia melanderi]|uniref:mitochondrial ribosomal protein L46 isoform X2 n=1 Tax=Nomia melanderi TaxID=2448451 RepID=UPI00130460B5|nr:39S ribosomal protein L46, mitochondrial isoform X2 [Nomia melanderi]
MLMKVLTFHTLKGNPSTAKVISRLLSQAIVKGKKEWDLLSAVCLERHPIITKPMEDIEARYQDMLRQIEFENSLLSETEIQMKFKENLNQKAVPSGTNIEDIMASNKKELMAFKFAPRINADEGKVVSLQRKLDKTLVLLVEKQLGNTNVWIPPQSIRKNTESMIETAQRTVQELCGNNIKVHFYGNAPIGFYQYQYPKDIRLKGKYGAKIFYFLAKYISGDISPNLNHCWLDREELKETVHPKLHESLSQFLLPE